MNIVKPRYVMPIHGEWRHLVANAEIAASVGIPEERILLTGDGVAVDLEEERAVIAGHVPLREVYVDGASVGSVNESLLKDRRILGEEGFLSVFAAVDLDNKQVIVGPELHERGVGQGHDHADISEQVRLALEAAMNEGVDDLHELSQKARKVVGKWVATTHRRKPMIVPVIIQV